MYKRPEPCAQIVAAYPHLAPWPLHPKTSRAALAAKNLQIDLKKAFPELKFSVKSKNYSGGSSVRANVDVYEVDGWKKEQVREFEQKARALGYQYSYGSFNGMDDSYNYKSDQDSRNFLEAFGSASYIFVDISLSYAPTDPKEIKKRLDKIPKPRDEKPTKGPKL